MRELENVIGHACMVAVGEVLDVADLPLYMREADARKSPAPLPFPSAEPEPGPEADGEPLSFDAQERQVIEQALDQAGGNQVHAARLLGITRDKLRYKIKKHNFALAGTCLAYFPAPRRRIQRQIQITQIDSCDPVCIVTAVRL